MAAAAAAAGAAKVAALNSMTGDGGGGKTSAIGGARELSGAIGEKSKEELARESKKQHQAVIGIGDQFTKEKPNPLTRPHPSATGTASASENFASANAEANANSNASSNGAAIGRAASAKENSDARARGDILAKLQQRYNSEGPTSYAEIDTLKARQYHETFSRSKKLNKNNNGLSPQKPIDESTKFKRQQQKQQHQHLHSNPNQTWPASLPENKNNSISIDDNNNNNNNDQDFNNNHINLKDTDDNYYLNDADDDNYDDNIRQKTNFEDDRATNKTLDYSNENENFNNNNKNFCNRNKQNEQKEQKEQHTRNLGKRYRRFKLRLWMAFCCLGYKKNKSSIADVSRLFARLYSGPNMGLSHIAASLVLIKRFQDKQQQWMLQQPELGIKQFLSSVPVTDKTHFLDLAQNAEESFLITDMIYFMNYSLSIFGWPLYGIDGVHQVCCLFPYCKINCCCRKNKTKQRILKEQDNAFQDEPFPIDYNDLPIVIGDNCVGCNLAAADRRLTEHNYDIIYINYQSAINVVPFIVVADHSKQKIVVGIRGSMALSDAVIDLNVMIEPLPLEPEQPEMYGHRGMILSASYIKETIAKHRVFEAAFSCRPDLGSENYTLLFCGHSLGGGIAAIMGLLYYKQYPTLKAYLYSPPGGILSLPAIELSKKFAHAVFLGNDCVPRAGLAQMERLRYQSYWVKKRVQQSNGRILARAFSSKFCCCSNEANKETYEYDPAHSLDICFGQASDCPPLNYKGQVIEFPDKDEGLYVPGKLIHIVKDYSFDNKRPAMRNPRDNLPLYRAIWVENTDYDRIVIDEGMVMDHMPFTLMNSMRMLFSRTIPANRIAPTTRTIPTTKQPRPSSTYSRNWFHDSTVCPNESSSQIHSGSAIINPRRDFQSRNDNQQRKEDVHNDDKLLIMNEEKQHHITQKEDYINRNYNNNNDIDYCDDNNNNNTISQSNYYKEHHEDTSPAVGSDYRVIDNNNNAINNDDNFGNLNYTTPNQDQQIVIVANSDNYSEMNDNVKTETTRHQKAPPQPPPPNEDHDDSNK